MHWAACDRSAIGAELNNLPSANLLSVSPVDDNEPPTGMQLLVGLSAGKFTALPSVIEFVLDVSRNELTTSVI